LVTTKRTCILPSNVGMKRIKFVLPSPSATEFLAKTMSVFGLIPMMTNNGLMCLV
jgi:hypothetical protein